MKVAKAHVDKSANPRNLLVQGRRIGSKPQLDCLTFGSQHRAALDAVRLQNTPARRAPYAVSVSIKASLSLKLQDMVIVKNSPPNFLL